MLSHNDSPPNDQETPVTRHQVLLISQYFPPEPTGIVQELAESLVEHGLDVTVLTGYPNYPYGRLYDGYQMKLWSKERVGNVNVIRLPLYCAHGRNGIARAINLSSFALSVALIGPWVSPKVDAIHVYQLVTVGSAARWLSFLRRIPMTIEVQDLWPDTLSATGMVDTGLALRLVGWFANRVYRSASHVRVISDGFRSALAKRGVAGKRLHVIPNWVDTELYCPESVDNELAKSVSMQGKFNVVFAGAIGLAQNLTTVIEAAEMLSSETMIQFVIIGDGSELDNLKSQVATRGLTNVRFIDRQPVSEMSRYYAISDVLLLHLRSTPLFEMTIPHKVYSYLACGKPVLAAIGGEAANVVTESGAGLVCPSDNPNAMVSGIRELYAMTPKQREELGRAGRQAALTKYSRMLLTGRVADMIRSAIADNRSSRHFLFDCTRRAVDIAVSILLLAILSPLLGLLALCVRIFLGSPVLFSQLRPGRHGKPFLMRKFRTMSDELDQNGNLKSDSERLGKFGTLLRSTSLDELPELWNVLRGDMSLVGPRPLLMQYLPLYSERQRRRHDVRPGVTGWAQINGRNAISWEEKFELDVWYVENRTLKLDLKILWMTLWQVLRRDGVSAEAHVTMPAFKGSETSNEGTA